MVGILILAMPLIVIPVILNGLAVGMNREMTKKGLRICFVYWGWFAVQSSLILYAVMIAVNQTLTGDTSFYSETVSFLAFYFLGGYALYFIHLLPEKYLNHIPLYVAFLFVFLSICFFLLIGDITKFVLTLTIPFLISLWMTQMNLTQIK